MDTAAAKAQATRIEFATKNLARLGGYGSWAGHYSRDLPAALEAQGGWNKAAAELARHDCNVGEFGCSAPDSKGLCTKHQLAEAQGKLEAVEQAIAKHDTEHHRCYLSRQIDAILRCTKEDK